MFTLKIYADVDTRKVFCVIDNMLFYLWWLYLGSPHWASNHIENEFWLPVITKEAVDPDSLRGERTKK